MPKQVRLSRPGANPARDAERRLDTDIMSLLHTTNGRRSLASLTRLLNGAKDLDLSQASALVSIVRAAYVGQKREQVLVRIGEALDLCSCAEKGGK